jgi:hypothetical protein
MANLDSTAEELPDRRPEPARCEHGYCIERRKYRAPRPGKQAIPEAFASGKPWNAGYQRFHESSLATGFY